MKKIKFFNPYVAVLSLLMIVPMACEDDLVVEPMMEDTSNSQTFLKSTGTDANTIEPVYLDLFTRNNTVVGHVSITNDEENVYVNYVVENGYKLTETKLFIGAKDDISLGRKCSQEQKPFLYKDKFEQGVTEFEYVHPITEGDSCLVIIANAKVDNGKRKGHRGHGFGHKYGKGKNCRPHGDKFNKPGRKGFGHGHRGGHYGHRNNGVYAWAGTISFEEYFGIKFKGYLEEYCIVKNTVEEEDKYFTLHCWVTRDHGNMWGILEAKDQYYFENNWCDQMGVIKLVSDTVANITVWDQKVGEADVKIQGDAITVDFTMNDGVLLFEVHTFYGTAEELSTHGSCPDYATFPNKFEGENIAHIEFPIN